MEFSCSGRGGTAAVGSPPGCSRRLFIVRVLVVALVLASGAAATTARAVGTATAPSIPPASLWAINETAQTDGIRTLTLPTAFVFLSWHRGTSLVPYHRGRDTVVEFSRGGHLAATWTATRVYPHGLAGCGNLYGPSPTRVRIHAHAVYSISRPDGSIAWMCVTDTASYPMVYQLSDSDQLPQSELASIVGNSRYRYAYTVSSFVDFWTPSRNIGCLAYVPGQGLDPGVLTCYIRSGLNPPPQRRTSDCRGRVFGWGSIVQLVLPQSASPVTAGYGCSTYEPVDTSARTLDYGHTINAFGATCQSMRTGLRCSNEIGHGFFLSRQRSYIF